MFNGLAIGGPLDGKRITHESDNYLVPEESDEVLPLYVKNGDVKLSDFQIQTFRYGFYKTPGGDVWLPSLVLAGRRYEHRVWGHPMEYIFSKLIRGYRPEGY